MYTYIGGRESIVGMVQFVMIIIFIVVLMATNQLWLLGDLGFPALDVTLARFHI